MMSKYAELKRKGQTAPADGIFYAFSDEQFAKGLAKCGYTQADVDSGKIVADGFGGYETKSGNPYQIDLVCYNCII